MMARDPRASCLPSTSITVACRAPPNGTTDETAAEVTPGTAANRWSTSDTKSDAEGQHVVGGESGIHVREAADGVQHQARRREQNNRQRDLRDDKRVADPPDRSRSGRSRGARQRLDEPIARPVRSDRAEDDADSDGEGGGEQRGPRVDVNRERRWQRR